MFTNFITLRLTGNAATQRGAWSVHTLCASFLDAGHFGEVSWTMHCAIDSDTVRIDSQEPYAARLMAYFVNHVRAKILRSLGDYRVNILVTVVKMSQNLHSESHRVGISIDYGARKRFNLVVMAPPIAQDLVGNFGYLFEQMETTSSWNVNSINNLASIPGGVQFISREEDVAGLIAELESCIQDQLPDMMSVIGDTTLLDVITVFMHRGSQLYIRVGLERLYNTDWGPMPPTMPLVDAPVQSIPPPNDFCAICRLELKQNVVRTQCQHVYHKNCMETLWQSGTAFKCPLCRTGISELGPVSICLPPVQRPVRRSMRLREKYENKNK